MSRAPTSQRTRDILGVIGLLVWLASIVLVYTLTGGNVLLAIVYAVVCGGVFGALFGALNT